MIWKICFFLSLLILCIAIIWAVRLSRKADGRNSLTPFQMIFAGFFASVFAGQIPIIYQQVGRESVLKMLLLDAVQTIQVFTANVGTEIIPEYITKEVTEIGGVYSVYMSILFVAAPLLTFGFVISLFRSALMRFLFRFYYFGDLYVFSVLSEKSLTLARDVKKNHPRAVIVFTQTGGAEEETPELYAEAKRMHALLFANDVVSSDFAGHSAKAKLTLILIGDDSDTNLVQALKVIAAYQNRPNTEVFVFSSGTEGELLLAGAMKGSVKVRRVDEDRSLVYRYLYDRGEEIYAAALKQTDGIKAIHAVVAGLGKYGTEMVKALSWYCQMDGYTVTIDAFDADPLAEEKFAARCPELMSEEYNGVVIPGESRYTIRIHSGVDVNTRTFADKITRMRDITFVFVCLGSDAVNLAQSANLRMLCERAGCKPLIRTVLYSTEGKDALQGITNYRGQAYDIEAIGDFETCYSEEVLMGGELEALALKRHLKYGDEDSFWQYEYNYRSSMASAIHEKARVFCGIPGAGKEVLTQQERDAVEPVEHCRWNAYMRSEGYIYSGSPDRSSRNDLAKMHHDLVNFDLLTEEEKRKDSGTFRKS